MKHLARKSIATPTLQPATTLSRSSLARVAGGGMLSVMQEWAGIDPYYDCKVKLSTVKVEIC